MDGGAKHGGGFPIMYTHVLQIEKKNRAPLAEPKRDKPAPPAPGPDAGRSETAV